MSISSIPAEILRATGEPPIDPPTMWPSLVTVSEYEIITWAKRIKQDDDGSTTYAEVWLDANAIPHRTGRNVPMMAHHVIPAATWTHPKPGHDVGRAVVRGDDDVDLRPFGGGGAFT